MTSKVRTITIVRPEQTQTLSVTGKDCQQNCTHCQGHFLSAMQTWPDLGHKSFLISGGFDENGCVPIDIELLKELKKKGKMINVHPGLVDEESAKLIGRYADVVSFDFVSDNKIIQNIYNLRKTEQDYIDSYLWLRKYARVVPHIMTGMGNESRSINILKKLGVDEVCMLILMKHPKIKNRLEEPSTEHIEHILKKARKVFRKLHLGCMRPLNRKKDIDRMAIRYVDSIVNPYHALDFSGYRIIRKDVCCSFL